MATHLITAPGKSPNKKGIVHIVHIAHKARNLLAQAHGVSY
jgi:hypothetical protein